MVRLECGWLAMPKVLEVDHGERIEAENGVRAGEACAVRVLEMQRNARDRLRDVTG